MLKQITKRNGTIVDFDQYKIERAIKSALLATPAPIDLSKTLTEDVIKRLEKIYQIPTIEQIQDIVEQTLTIHGFDKTAELFKIYRAERQSIRQRKNPLESAIIELCDKYIHQVDLASINENSNMGFSLAGLNNYIVSKFSQIYWLNKIHDPDGREAHEQGRIHIHDLGLISTYCTGWDLQDLLIQGFCGVKGKVESNPPKHLSSALGQMVNFIYSLQGECAGAQAFSNFDTLLAPFIRYDNLTHREVTQQMQEFIFNLNVPTRMGFQTPFSNLTIDLTPPKHLGDLPVVIGGKPQKETYKEFQPEMNVFNRAFCEVMMEGDRKGQIFTFPLPTINLTKDFDWDDPQLDVLWEITAKYGIPTFANFINSGMTPDQVTSMCCRLRIDRRELLKRGGGLFASAPLTGSTCVCTINLPRLAYETKNLEDYFEQLNDLIDLSRRVLVNKHKALEYFTDLGLYPYIKHYLKTVKERKGGYWANHFNTIGVIGMNEACLNMFGQDISTDIGKKLAIDTLNFIRDKIVQFQEEDGLLYNLEATPGEGTTYRLAKLDRKQYQDIITAGTNEPYYTNSTHLPVGHTKDIFEALEHQDELLCLYTGGSIWHGFLGERIDDINVCKQLVRKIAESFKLPYFTISPTFTICPEHGYIAGEHHNCPYIRS